MKVLVYFQPSPKHDNFEGARMRKTIKGALEVIDQQYTSNLYDDYDVAHFMSPDDESKLIIALERNHHLSVFVFMCKKSSSRIIFTK